MAYYQRVEELLGLMNSESQQRALAASEKANLDRKTLRRMRQRTQNCSPGPLSLEQVHEIAGRYALWTVRRKLDSAALGPDASPMTKRLHVEIRDGIYDLDVHLRRQVEALHLSGRQDLNRAAELRTLVESRAGQLGATLAVADTAEQIHEDWESVARAFDPICNDLDWLLSLCGSPGLKE